MVFFIIQESVQLVLVLKHSKKQWSALWWASLEKELRTWHKSFATARQNENSGWPFTSPGTCSSASLPINFLVTQAQTVEDGGVPLLFHPSVPRDPVPHRRNFPNLRKQDSLFFPLLHRGRTAESSQAVCRLCKQLSTKPRKELAATGSLLHFYFTKFTLPQNCKVPPKLPASDC